MRVERYQLAVRSQHKKVRGAAPGRIARSLQVHYRVEGPVRIVERVDFGPTMEFLRLFLSFVSIEISGVIRLQGGAGPGPHATPHTDTADGGVHTGVRAHRRRTGLPSRGLSKR